MIMRPVHAGKLDLFQDVWQIFRITASCFELKREQEIDYTVCTGATSDSPNFRVAHNEKR